MLKRSKYVDNTRMTWIVYEVQKKTERTKRPNLIDESPRTQGDRVMRDMATSH